MPFPYNIQFSYLARPKTGRVSANAGSLLLLPSLGRVVRVAVLVVMVGCGLVQLVVGHVGGVVGGGGGKAAGEAGQLLVVVLHPPAICSSTNIS